MFQTQESRAAAKGKSGGESMRWTGTRLDGRYLIEERLGSGAGNVYRARHAFLDKEVAIKFLGSARGDHAAIERFLLEARMLGRIRHPHVVEIHDCGIDGRGELYLVMELLAGRDLRAELADRRWLDWPTLKRIATQIGSALACCHADRILHRALAPANVLLTRGPDGEPHAKLIDFGLSRLRESRPGHGPAQASTLIGSPSFVAPEQLLEVPLDHRVDVYAFGCLLFTMATGRAPFEGGDGAMLIGDHLSRPVPQLDVATGRRDLPVGLQRLIERCMEKNRENRPASMTEVLSRLDALDEHRATLRTVRIERSHLAVLLARCTPSADRAQADQERLVLDGAELTPLPEPAEAPAPESPAPGPHHAAARELFRAFRHQAAVVVSLTALVLVAGAFVLLPHRPAPRPPAPAPSGSAHPLAHASPAAPARDPGVPEFLAPAPIEPPHLLRASAESLLDERLAGAPSIVFPR